MLVFPEQLNLVFKRIREAYNKSETPILVLTAPDCDSICAARIFLALLRTEGLTYQIEPVQGYGDVDSVKQKILLPRIENGEMHSVVMINCGAKVDVLTFFFGEEGEVPPDITFYIIDNHRPFDLNNIHADQQVLLFEEEGGKRPEDYPEPLEDISDGEEEDEDDFGDDNMDADEEFGEPEDGGRKRKRLTKRSDNEARKKRKKAELADEEYYAHNKYGCSSAGIMLRMAQSLSKEDNDMLWCAVLGMTDLYVHDHITRAQYTRLFGKLAQLVTQKNKDMSGGEEFNLIAEISKADESAADDVEHVVTRRRNGHIQQGYEFQFFLMRHWTLYDAMYHSRYVATKMGVWKETGKDNLDEMLAKMGLSIKEVTCPFQNMAQAKRKVLSIHMKEYMNRDVASLFEEFQMGKELSYPSFTRQHGANFTSAADLVHAVTALLEDDAYHHVDDHDAEEESGIRPGWRECFNNAYDCVSKGNRQMFEKGIAAAIRRQKDIVIMGTGLIDKQQVRTYPYMRCATIEQKSNFTTPLSLCKLAMFVVDAYACTRKNYSPKPFVLAALIDGSNSYLVAGIRSRGASEKGGKNSFNKAFKAAAQDVDARFRHDGFEGSVIEIQRDDFKKFQEYLYCNVVDHM